MNIQFVIYPSLCITVNKFVSPSLSDILSTRICTLFLCVMPMCLLFLPRIHFLFVAMPRRDNQQKVGLANMAAETGSIDRPVNIAIVWSSTFVPLSCRAHPRALLLHDYWAYFFYLCSRSSCFSMTIIFIYYDPFYYSKR